MDTHGEPASAQDGKEKVIRSTEGIHGIQGEESGGGY